MNKRLIIIPLALYAFSFAAYGQFADPVEILRLTRLQYDIKPQENAYAKAYSAGNAAAAAAIYSETAVAMWDDRPAVVGRVAIQKELEASFVNGKPKYTLSLESTDVFGTEKQATVAGNVIGKDTDGKVVYTGKYMAVWIKHNDGQWVCYRTISNDNEPDK